MDHLYFEKGECCRALKSLPFAENKFAGGGGGGGSTVVAMQRIYVLWCKSCLRSAVCMYFENREVQNGLKSFLRSTQSSKNTQKQQSFCEYKYNPFDSQIHLNVVIVLSGFVYIKYPDLGFRGFCYFNFVTCDIFEITDHAQDDISPSETITAHL